MEQNQQQYKKLYRSRTNRVLFGVCGGLGEYLGVDPLIVRILFLLLIFGAGSGILLYLVLAFLIPIAPSTLTGSSSSSSDFRERAQELAWELREQSGLHSRANWLGAIIVLFGVLLLMDQLFPMHWLRWNLFWPVIFIIFGLLILSRSRRD